MVADVAYVVTAIEAASLIVVEAFVVLAEMIFADWDLKKLM